VKTLKVIPCNVDNCATNILSICIRKLKSNDSPLRSIKSTNLLDIIVNDVIVNPYELEEMVIFTGSSWLMHEYVQNAITYDHSEFFITFTRNLMWEEINFFAN